MPKKKAYRIRNWKEYNNALKQRGSITLWLDKDAVDAWLSHTQTGKRGRPLRYTDLAIQCCFTLKALFKLPLRATQGLVDSLLQLMQVPLSAPDYSLLCKRQNNLTLSVPEQHKMNEKESIHLVIDATGLKVYGEGEWKVRKHGKEKRRTWLKLHLAINEASHHIEACMLTGDDVHDSETLHDLLAQVDSPIDQVTGDGAFDTHDAYQSVIDKGGTPCFPPRANARRHKATDEAWRQRNHAVSQVNYHSLKYWKNKHGYHRRSLAETAMFRFKQLLGEKVQARTMKRQAVEIGIKCLIINKMNTLGMPLTQKV